MQVVYSQNGGLLVVWSAGRDTQISYSTTPPSLTVAPARAQGTVTVPSSKSHTIRALLIAACADGTSRIENVLDSADAASCIAAVRALGATVNISPGRGEAGGLSVEVIPPTGGILGGALGERGMLSDDGGHPEPAHIDVGNSGTTLYLLTGLAALRPGGICFDGDASIRRRSAALLHDALRALGATVSTPSGYAPYCVSGPPQAGRTVAVESPTSQYLSALLLMAPLIPAPMSENSSGATTGFDIRLLYERPYVDMTCWWLDQQGIEYSRSGYEFFGVSAGQRYRPFERALPGDYSSATFWFCAAAVTGGTVQVRGLAPDDVQGDRQVLEILRELGCSVEQDAETVRVSGPMTSGGRFDLNAMPDALPALAVAACFAPDRVELVNVPQAREKETDRIAVMASELARLGARVEELTDGLVVYSARGSLAGAAAAEPSTDAGSDESARLGGAATNTGSARLGDAATPASRIALQGGTVSSHGDHRVAMALAVAALGACGAVTIEDAGAAAVTYPEFFTHLAQIAPGSVQAGVGQLGSASSRNTTESTIPTDSA
ncbi:MAG: 3-phosphoshikimate 1-carboxyvinyltransferase [Alkalispirochaeta sp.]